MADDAAIEARFWKEFKASPILMLGLSGSTRALGQPMTAVYDDDHGPFWFFTNKDNTLVSAMNESHEAIANFVGKGHDFFAAIHGTLVVDNDPATIDRLWNPHVAAWFEGGRDDPKVTLLRLDTSFAQLWENASSFAAAIKRMFGTDPKEAAKNDMAKVSL